MSFELIEEGINKIHDVTSWNSLLISYNHKSRPNDYICYNMNFQTSELLRDTINHVSNSYFNAVKSFDGKVLEYTGANPRNVVDKISTTNPLISSNWNSIVQHINSSDDTTSLKDIKANAYIFVGTYKSTDGKSQNLYLLTRKNPILTYKKGRPKKIFASRHNIIEEIDEPLVQFGTTCDALIYKGNLYMINSNCESVFNMEYSHKIICEQSLEKLETLNLIKDIDLYKNYAKSKQVPRKFITYNDSISQKLTKPKWRNLLSKELHIPFDSKSNKFDLNKEIHAKNFTLAVCGKTKLDMFEDNICEVPTSTPLKF